MEYLSQYFIYFIRRSLIFLFEIGKIEFVYIISNLFNINCCSMWPPPLSQKRATPLPPVFYFTKRTPTSPVLHKTGPLPPHCSSPKRCVSRGASDGRGRGPHPSGKEEGGWGDRMKGWGYPPLLRIRKRPPSRFRKFS